jgi:hypothetical protein
MLGGNWPEIDPDTDPDSDTDTGIDGGRLVRESQGYFG